jgi:hypothetical protein
VRPPRPAKPPGVWRMTQPRFKRFGGWPGWEPLRAIPRKTFRDPHSAACTGDDNTPMDALPVGPMCCGVSPKRRLFQGNTARKTQPNEGEMLRRVECGHATPLSRVDRVRARLRGSPKSWTALNLRGREYARNATKWCPDHCFRRGTQSDSPADIPSAASRALALTTAWRSFL